MQYPFRVVLATEDAAHAYVVRANDVRQARSRALRKYREELGADAPEPDPLMSGRAVNLNPKQQDGRYLPCADRTVVGDACDTPTSAVEAAVRWLESRRSS